MKKIIILLIISIFFSGCASKPSDPKDFNQDRIGSIYIDAEFLSYLEASYLYMGTEKNNLLMLREINAENYQDAFGIKEKTFAYGLYNEYLKINPGLHDFTIVSLPQGGHVGGGPDTITTIDLSYEFLKGHVYIFYQKESGKIDVLYWKIESEETYKDEIKLIKNKD